VTARAVPLSSSLLFPDLGAVEFERFLQGMNRTASMVVGRLLGGDLLEREPAASPRTGRSRAGSAGLKAGSVRRTARRSGDENHAREEYGPEGLEFHEREDDDTHHHHEEQAKLVPHRGWSVVLRRALSTAIPPWLPRYARPCARAVVPNTLRMSSHPAYQTGYMRGKNTTRIRPSTSVEDNPAYAPPRSNLSAKW